MDIGEIIIAALFSMIASIIHFQIPAAIGFLILAGVLSAIAGVVSDS